jgi:CubicO group peptidase (beta-lactamase class C family)
MRRLIAALMLCAGPAWGQALPVFSPTGPDAAAYGEAADYPLRQPGTPRAQQHLIAEFSRNDAFAPARRIPRPPVASVLARAPRELTLSWTHRGRPADLADYLARHPTTGLLVMQNRTILAERYQYGRTDQHRFLSQSMAKTVTAMLVGIAVAEGHIRAIDDLAQDYVPALKGSAIGETPIRALLHMASGLAYREVYDGQDDAAKLNRGVFSRGGQGAVQTVRQFETREAPPGTKWHYKGLDTETLGLVLMAATGMPMADYLASRIWQKIGAEADAAWTIDNAGKEVGFCCLSVTLRDWARLGALLAQDGMWEGQQIIPAAWVRAATTVQAPYLAPGSTGTGNYYGYGYQVWLLPGQRRQFVLLGIHGQALYVDPQSKLVMVHTAARVKPTGDPMAPELGALWAALVAQEGR